MRTFVPDRTCWSLLLTALAIRLKYKPTYDKPRVLIINKDVRKLLARKNGNEILSGAGTTHVPFNIILWYIEKQFRICRNSTNS